MASWTFEDIQGVGDSGLDTESCYFFDPENNNIPGPAHRKVKGYRYWTGDMQDGNGHGTHVSGTVAGSAIGGDPQASL
jgi:subtilisin family serine protease